MLPTIRPKLPPINYTIYYASYNSKKNPKNIFSNFPIYDLWMGG